LQKFDSDYLTAAKIPPYHSWRNPVERVPSLLNLRLQCVEVMRREGSELFKKEMSKCGNMKALRKAGDKREGFKSDLYDSVEPIKILLAEAETTTEGEKHFLHVRTLQQTMKLQRREELKCVDAKCGDPQSIKTKVCNSRKSIIKSRRHHYFEIKKLIAIFVSLSDWIHLFFRKPNSFLTQCQAKMITTSPLMTFTDEVLSSFFEETIVKRENVTISWETAKCLKRKPNV